MTAALTLRCPHCTTNLRIGIDYKFDDDCSIVCKICGNYILGTNEEKESMILANTRVYKKPTPSTTTSSSTVLPPATGNASTLRDIAEKTVSSKPKVKQFVENVKLPQGDSPFGKDYCDPNSVFGFYP